MSSFNNNPFESLFGDLESLKHHYKQATCKYCDKSYLEQNIEQHSLKCKLEKVQCDACKYVYLRYEFINHKSACPDQIMRCALCYQESKRRLMDDHHSVCPDAYIKCTSCTKELRRRSMDEHLADSCMESNAQCSYCDATMLRKTLGEHHRICSEFGIKCEICHCYYARKNRTHHLKHICAKGLVTCICGEINLRKDHNEHMQTCSKVYVPCKYAFHDTPCKFQTARHLMSAHEKLHIQDEQVEYKEETGKFIGMHFDVFTDGKWYPGKITEIYNETKTFKVESLIDSSVCVLTSDECLAPYGNITKYGFYVGKKIYVAFPDGLAHSEIIDIKDNAMRVRRLKDGHIEENIPMNHMYCVSSDFHQKVGVIVCVEFQNKQLTGQICKITRENVMMKIIKSGDDLNSETGEILYSYDEYDKLVAPYWMIYGFANEKRTSFDVDGTMKAILFAKGVKRLFNGH